MAVDFRVEILAKLLLVPEEGLFGLLFADVEQQLRHFAIQSAGGAHHAFGVRRQEVLVNARNVIEALNEGRRTQASQVVVARLVLGEQGI